MKFNKNNTALSFLEAGSKRVFSSATNDLGVRQAFQFMNAAFPEEIERYTQKVQYVCATFYDAFSAGQSKLWEVLEKESITQSGCFVLPGLSGTATTYFYDVDYTPGEDAFRLKGTIIAFLMKSSMPEPYLLFYQRGSDRQIEQYTNPDPNMAGSRQVAYHIGQLLTLIMFIKYCPTATKIVPGGKKDHHGGVKYLNETKIPIQVLDAPWFTTVIRTEGFMVGEEHARVSPLAKVWPRME